MMKILIIFFILSACAEEKQELASKSIVEKVIEISPLNASYDKGLDLILIGSYFQIWQIQKQTPTDTCSPSTYWDSNNNIYYHATLEITNNILYTINSNLQYEKTTNPLWVEKYSEYGNTNILAEFLYVGSLEPLKRIYYDPINKIQYIKTLKLVNTDKYTIRYRNLDGTSYYKTNYTDLPVYPTHEDNLITYLTNKQNQKFYISGDGFHHGLSLDNRVGNTGDNSDGDY